MIAEFLRSLYTCAGRNLVFLRQLVGFVCREMETARGCRGHFSKAAPAASQSLPRSPALVYFGNKPTVIQTILADSSRESRSLFSGHSSARAPNKCSGGRIKIPELDMSEKESLRRGAFSLLGVAAALGFVVPTTVLITSEAEAQAQPATPTPSAPAPSGPAPSGAAPSGAATPGMTRRQARHNARKMRREARRNARETRREARHNARMQRREARRGNSLYMKSNETTKQK